MSLRYFNVYGPRARSAGTYGAVFGVFLKQKLSNKSFTVVGNGNQKRDFLYIDDCIDGTLRLFNSNYSDPVNIGSDEQVSINQMIEIIEDVSGTKKLERVYQLDKPKGVRGRSSNNDLIKKVFGDKGSHTRAAVSTNSLPLGVAVEVDAIFEIN